MTEFVVFPSFSFGSGSFPLVIAGLSVWLYLLYRWALPRPIPGIPYNKGSANRLFGDVPEMLAYANKTKEVFAWVGAQNARLKSPIVQLFCRPLGRPWVVISDFRESQDILLRRTKEFDRSEFFGDIFKGILPDHHISLKTNDLFKAHRRLLQDLMTPAFLNEIAAPQIYTTAMDLIALWEKKSELAQNHPFSAALDVYHGALDAVWAFTFGADSQKGTLKTQIQFLDSMKALDLPSDIEKPVEFPHAPNPPAFEAIFTLTESVEVSIKSPFPRLHYKLLQLMPYMRKAQAAKEKGIMDELEKGIKRLAGKEHDDRTVRCAMDDVLRREYIVAQKEGRPPMYDTRVINDELFGFLVGGHDTTSTTFTWGLKFLADNQDMQRRLRSEIYSALPIAAAEKRNPSAQEITKAHIPYLDAFMEELFRCALTAEAIIRVATVDTQVLGHRIPKGTDVFFMNCGPSIHSEAFKIDEKLRSPSCRAAEGRIGAWDPEDVGSFKPERWLVPSKEEDGKVVFDQTAGPHLTFGLGPRGCFGRRLAYLESRLIIALIIWNFELQKLSEELSGYEAVDKMTHQPQKCYVRLVKVQ